jgi:hypothetical protein
MRYAFTWGILILATVVPIHPQTIDIVIENIISEYLYDTPGTVFDEQSYVYSINIPTSQSKMQYEPGTNFYKYVRNHNGRMASYIYNPYKLDSLTYRSATMQENDFSVERGSRFDSPSLYYGGIAAPQISPSGKTLIFEKFTVKNKYLAYVNEPTRRKEYARVNPKQGADQASEFNVGGTSFTSYETEADWNLQSENDKLIYIKDGQIYITTFTGEQSITIRSEAKHTGIPLEVKWLDLVSYIWLENNKIMLKRPGKVAIVIEAGEYTELSGLSANPVDTRWISLSGTKSGVQNFKNIIINIETKEHFVIDADQIESQDFNGGWSPDGCRFAFCRTGDNRTVLSMIDLTEKSPNVYRLSPPEQDVWNEAAIKWAPDASGIFYLVQKNDQTETALSFVDVNSYVSSQINLKYKDNAEVFTSIDYFDIYPKNIKGIMQNPEHAYSLFIKNGDELYSVKLKCTPFSSGTIPEMFPSHSNNIQLNSEGAIIRAEKLKAYANDMYRKYEWKCSENPIKIQDAEDDWPIEYSQSPAPLVHELNLSCTTQRLDNLKEEYRSDHEKLSQSTLQEMEQAQDQQEARLKYRSVMKKRIETLDITMNELEGLANTMMGGDFKYLHAKTRQKSALISLNDKYRQDMNKSLDHDRLYPGAKQRLLTSANQVLQTITEFKRALAGKAKEQPNGIYNRVYSTFSNKLDQIETQISDISGEVELEKRVIQRINSCDYEKKYAKYDYSKKHNHVKIKIAKHERTTAEWERFFKSMKAVETDYQNEIEEAKASLNDQYRYYQENKEAFSHRKQKKIDKLWKSKGERFASEKPFDDKFQAESAKDIEDVQNQKLKGITFQPWWKFYKKPLVKKLEKLTETE